jgi:hypothetical protein
VGIPSLRDVTRPEFEKRHVKNGDASSEIHVSGRVPALIHGYSATAVPALPGSPAGGTLLAAPLHGLPLPRRRRQD